MAKTVDLQVRKVPKELRDRLRTRARIKGVTMSRYVVDLLENDLDRPTMEEWLEEVRRLPRIPLPKGVTGATLIREAREERDREMDERIDRIIDRRRAK